MGTKTNLILLLLFSLSGCGFFSKKVESIVEKAELQNNPPVKPVKKNLYCIENSKLQLMLEDELTQKFYRPLSGTLFENKNYSFVQKSAMLSLIEMMRRPDIVSPTSRFQFFLRLKGNDYYFDFASTVIKSETETTPLLSGIEYLVKNFDNPNGLTKIAEVLDASVPPSIDVSPELENFLQLHRNALSQNEELTEYFFKGDETLTRHESLKRHSFKKIVQQYLKGNKSLSSSFIQKDFSLKRIDSGSDNLQLQCNLNITNEIISREELLETKIEKHSHYFALMEGNNIFIAVTSSILPEKITNLKGSYFINTATPSMPIPICQYKNKIQDIVLFSTKGRFPTQHLGHLLTYDIGNADSQENLKEMLTFSRHLFLSTPDRILYESKRGRKAQLDFFLSMNFPIYHVSALGDIIGAALFSNPSENSKSLVIDDRSSARLRCVP